MTENLSTLKIHKLTKEQYEREAKNGNIEANALYLTPDEEIDLSPYATKEDMTEIKNELDSLKGTKKLVWQNDHPNINFTAQTVLVDIDDYIDLYDGIEVLFTNGDEMMSTTGVLPTTHNGFYMYAPYDITDMGMCMRKCRFMDNSVIFETGYYRQNSSTQEDNGACIPYRIYLYR